MTRDRLTKALGSVDARSMNKDRVKEYSITRVHLEVYTGVLNGQVLDAVVEFVYASLCIDKETLIGCEKVVLVYENH